MEKIKTLKTAKKAPKIDRKKYTGFGEKYTGFGGKYTGFGGRPPRKRVNHAGLRASKNLYNLTNLFT